MQFSLFHQNKKEQTDRELLEAYLRSVNQEFLGVLFERYIYLVYGVCLNHFGEKETSKDAVIEIYVKVQQEIHKHKIRNFKNWLYVVTKNHCLMQLRKTKPGETILFSNEKELDFYVENEEKMHPVDGTTDEMEETALEECVEKLKDEQRRCIQLFYYKGKSYREIAAALNIDVKKVKSFIQNGKRNLKICLERKK